MKNKNSDKDFEYLKTIFDKSADGLIISDSKGFILKLNKSAAKLNGIKAAEVIGKNVRTLVKEGSIDRSAIQEVLDTKRQVSVIQNTEKSGYSLLVTGTPVFDENREISYVIVNERDISLIENMRKRLEQARQESEKIKNELTELTLLELKQNNIVAESTSMQHTLKLALKLSQIQASNILILGESGTGKGLLSKFIHKQSFQNKKPFIQVNCAALPENLLEAELFGYVKGAFTGASEQGKPGLFELASDGTIFLDEIGEISLQVQAKLLKFLDDHEIMPIGGTHPKKINCSIIAATNKNLEARTEQKKFRLDLFHRLNTFTITIPPLRERPEDIFELINIYLRKYNKEYNRKTTISYHVLKMLESYEFSGNVRELINIIKQAVVMSEKKSLDELIINSISINGTGKPIKKRYDTPSSLVEAIETVEKEMLNIAAIKCTTTRQAAAFLKISQPTVVRKFKKHGLSIIKTI